MGHTRRSLSHGMTLNSSYSMILDFNKRYQIQLRTPLFCGQKQALPGGHIPTEVSGISILFYFYLHYIHLIYGNPFSSYIRYCKKITHYQLSPIPPLNTLLPIRHLSTKKCKSRSFFGYKLLLNAKKFYLRKLLKCLD